MGLRVHFFWGGQAVLHILKLKAFKMLFFDHSKYILVPYLVAEMASDNARLLSYFLDKISFGGQDPKVIMINCIYHSHKIFAIYFF